jgi:nucleoid-associated protein YgaU
VAAAQPAAVSPPAALPPAAAPPASLAAAASRLQLETVDYDDRGEIRFSGTAPPGAPVRVYVDNRPAGTATADAAGRWSLVPEATVAPGTHALRVDQVTESGAVARRVEVPFQRVAVAPGQVRPGTVVVQPGQNLWRIARATYGQGLRYTVIYQANREQIRDPNRIYPGQIFSLPEQGTN